MARSKTTGFFCKECGNEFAKWMGRCSACGTWNSIVERPVSREVKGQLSSWGVTSSEPPKRIREIDPQKAPRFSTGSTEFDRVLGGGLVPGSVTLLVGEPGIGKSTCLSMLAHRVGESQGRAVLYVAGEESLEQIRLRHDRLGALSDNLYVLSESNMDVVVQYAVELKPILLIVDSIQTMFAPDVDSTPGSVAQIKECTAALIRIAKNHGTAVVMVGHVTKDGDVQGPRLLEHMVDTVLTFEGDKYGSYRLLRSSKNRYGAPELGVMEMTAEGLIDAPNASALFLDGRPTDTSGSIVVPAIDGTRPLMVEVQALLGASPYNNPQRTADGIDMKRLRLMVAVLERRVGIRLGQHDVYVKLSGGLTVEDPAIDLGLAVAMASSYRDRVPDPHTAVAGEVGLGGEVRAIARIEQRIKEAEKMGFTRVIVPKANLDKLAMRSEVEVIGVSNVQQALEHVLM